MNQNKKFDDILNECLDRILRGETVEQCLQNYPDQAKELEPLLQTAQAARVASTIQPRAEFKARARSEFQSAVQEMKTGKGQRTPFFSWHWQWQSGWAIALTAVVVVILAGVGIVAGADHSMPDSPLYSVKLAAEQVQLTLTFSDIGKAELNARFAERRVEEIVYMASRDNENEVQIVARRLNSNLENITNLAGTISGQPAGANAPGYGPESVPSSQDNQQPMLGAASSPAAGSGALPPAAAPAPTTNVTIAAPAAPAPAPSVKAAQALPPSSPSPAAGPNITASAPPAPQNVQANQNARNAGKGKTAEQERLKQIVISNNNTLQDKLDEALRIAPPGVRPAVRQAIAQSQAEYEKALQNIDMAENAN